MLIGEKHSSLFRALVSYKEMKCCEYASRTMFEMTVNDIRTAHFKKCKQLFEYKHLLLLIDIW
jgi:hypothetical protein